ncbi:MAG: NADH:flavin oxidoreductase [Salinisphaera sp.]|jgi:2,4-dienoyl-CoA reductase-like NADH-dependent reductase (Old Yellow Enzyme family)|nr:NADH:flavin oxidoreductase [Salinisphaera sp.]
MADNQATLESERYPILFSPIRIDSLTLANRAAVSPMTRTSAHRDGTATDQMLEYYRRYARGGFGLVITEGTYTDTAHAQGYFQQPGIATDAQAAAWQPVVDAVHAAGAAIVMQLMHAGAQGQHDDTPTVAPSAVRPHGEKSPIYHNSGTYDLPDALTETGIIEVIDGFVASARRAQQSGFDGVEIHAANGYLLDEFITTYHNLRDDEYGGDIGNRVRMVRRVVQSVRDAVGADFTVGVRLSQTKIHDTEYRWNGPQDAALIFRAMAEAGASYIHVTGAGAVDPAFSDDGPSLVELAAEHGRGIAVIANGALHDADKAEAQLASGKASLTAIARAALVNADWPQRIAEDRAQHDFDPDMLQPLATLDSQVDWEQGRTDIFEPLHKSV